MRHRPSVSPSGRPRRSPSFRGRSIAPLGAPARRWLVGCMSRSAARCGSVRTPEAVGGRSRDWSRGRVPDKRDMACVRRGVTIALSGGHYVVGSLIDGGATIITHGALLIADPRVVSQFAVMRVTDGRLTWAGVVDGGTLDANRGSDIVSGTPAGAALQRRLPCLPGYTSQRQIPTVGHALTRRPTPKRCARYGMNSRPGSTWPPRYPHSLNAGRASSAPCSARRGAARPSTAASGQLGRCLSHATRRSITSSPPRYSGDSAPD